MLNDQQLLDSLSVTLAPPAADPTEQDLCDLRALVLVSGLRDQQTGSRAADRDQSGWKRRLTVLLLGAAVAGAGGVAVATGGEIPRPLRGFAHAVGLPVESVALSDARHAMAVLAAALAGQGNAESAGSAAALRERLAALDDKELDAVEPQASALLAAADTDLAAPPPPPQVQPEPVAVTGDPSAPSGGGGSARGEGGGSGGSEPGDDHGSGPGPRDGGKGSDPSQSGSGGGGDGGPSGSGSSGSAGHEGGSGRSGSSGESRSGGHSGSGGRGRR